MDEDDHNWHYFQSGHYGNHHGHEEHLGYDQHHDDDEEDHHQGHHQDVKNVNH
jgi:hypothetical protein